MSVKNWFLQNLRRAVGTQAILDRLAVHGGWCSHTSRTNGKAAGKKPPLDLAALDKMEGLYQRILDPAVDDAALGFQREQMPCLIDLNGDLLWVPADLLGFLWHTRAAAEPALVLHFLAETPHYLWIRARLRPGDVAVDCGANMGLFTLMMAERVGPGGSVYAFEPSPGSRRDLGRVLRLNRPAAAVVVNACALSDTCGEATFCDVMATDVRREASHLSALGRIGFIGGPDHQVVVVPTTTLDAYVAERKITPRLVKIDVEGAEFLVLEGARNCLTACQPLLVIEIHQDERGEFDHTRLKKYLDQYGYKYAQQDKTYYCEAR